MLGTRDTHLKHWSGPLLGRTSPQGRADRRYGKPFQTEAKTCQWDMALACCCLAGSNGLLDKGPQSHHWLGLVYAPLKCSNTQANKYRLGTRVLKRRNRKSNKPVCYLIHSFWTKETRQALSFSLLICDYLCYLKARSTVSVFSNKTDYQRAKGLNSFLDHLTEEADKIMHPFLH